MALAFLFSRASMNAAQYDECAKQLEAAGAGAPAGRRYHVCFGDGARLQVLDVWDSAEQFEQFGQTLMPILTGLGADSGQPEVYEIRNIIAG